MSIFNLFLWFLRGGIGLPLLVGQIAMLTVGKYWWKNLPFVIVFLPLIALLLLFARDLVIRLARGAG